MEFREITRSDIPFLKRVYENYAGFSSDCNCVNLYAWKDETQTRICVDCGCLLARFVENGNRIYLFPVPFENGDALAAIEHLRAFERSEGASVLRVMCSRGQETLLPETFVKTERPDLYDYIALADNLIACEGKRYRHLRNHISAFQSDGEYAYETLTKANADAFMQVVRECAGLHSDRAFDTEVDVAQLMLDMLDEADELGLIITTHARPIGAILGSMPRKDLLDIHLRYGHRAYRGIYDAITHAFLINVRARYPVQYVNFENDLGIEGLRTAKQRIPPDILAEKYLCVCPL